MFFLIEFLLTEQFLHITGHFAIESNLLEVVVSVKIIIFYIFLFHSQELDCELPFLQACELSAATDCKLFFDLFDGASHVLLRFYSGHSGCTALLGLRYLLKVRIVLL